MPAFAGMTRIPLTIPTGERGKSLIWIAIEAFVVVGIAVVDTWIAGVSLASR